MHLIYAKNNAVEYAGVKKCRGRNLNFKLNAHSLRRRWKGRFEFIFVNAYANIITVGTI